MKNILLRSSWQSVNIGDIAHTPGILRLLRENLPDVAVTLWPCDVGRGVREMLLREFPGLTIVEGTHDQDVDAPAVRAAFASADFFLHGSGPGLDVKGVNSWRRLNGKPYGVYGHSFAGEPEALDTGRRDVYDHAAFVYCRDSASLGMLRQLGIKCPQMAFGPDATFGLDLEDNSAADAFLAAMRLEPKHFVCVIPRLRYTPKAHPDGSFYYEDTTAGRERAEVSERFKEGDHAKLREAIGRILAATDLKILICPEMTYQVELGKTMLYDRLPAESRGRVVWRDRYWRTDEAQTVYGQAHSMISVEMHSPILAVSAGVPAIYLRQPTDTCKGQMWRDIGLSDWILELDDCDGADIARAALSIAADYPEALRETAAAMRFAAQKENEAFQFLKSTLYAETIKP